MIFICHDNPIHISQRLLKFRGRFAGRPSAEKRAGGRKLITRSSRAAFPEDPTAVVASNEASAAALHFADSGTSADEAAWIALAVASWGSGDGGSECDDGDEERFHIGLIFFVRVGVEKNVWAIGLEWKRLLDDSHRQKREPFI